MDPVQFFLQLPVFSPFRTLTAPRFSLSIIRILFTMSKKLLVVFGATGQQGGSVIGYVLRDPELSNTYSIRALTRDPASAASRNLASAGVEVIQCDNDSKDSLSKALEGAHTVFSMTSTSA